MIRSDCVGDFVFYAGTAVLNETARDTLRDVAHRPYQGVLCRLMSHSFLWCTPKGRFNYVHKNVTPFQWQFS